MKYRELLITLKEGYTPQKRAEEKKSDFPAYILYRPLSLLVSPYFIKMRISANSATVISIAISFIQIPAAWFGGEFAYMFVAGGGILFHVLDCVDGNLARYHKKPSAVGEMLDSIASMIFWFCFMIAAGILAYRLAPTVLGGYALNLGLALAVLYLLHRELEDTMQMYLSTRVTWTPPPTEWRTGNVTRKTSRIEWDQVGKVTENVYTIAILVCAGYAEKLDIYFAAMFIYQLVLFMIWLPRYVHTLMMRARQP